MTPYFKIQYSKKGMLPSGVNEEVYIQFTPDQYQYYYDCMRLHCEGEKITIPIHGYPVINNKKDQLLPSLIDFGQIKVGEEYRKKLVIESTTPVSFQYEFEWDLAHPDMSIEPMSGDIPGKSKTVVELVYNPHESTTASARLKLITTEFDQEPQIVQIIGSASHTSKNVQDMDETVTRKTLLTQKQRKRPPSGKLDKI